MKKLIALLIAVAIAAPVLVNAEDLYIDTVGSPTIITKSGKSLVIGTIGSSDSVKLSVGGSTIGTVSSTGFDLGSSALNFRVAEYVATPATNLTPVAGTNDFKPNTVIAAAGPTNQAIALPASPTDGERRWGYNGSANPVVVAALGTPVMNGGAGRRTVWPTRTVMHCRYSAALAEWQCYPSAAVPTPIS